MDFKHLLLVVLAYASMDTRERAELGRLVALVKGMTEEQRAMLPIATTLVEHGINIVDLKEAVDEPSVEKFASVESMAQSIIDKVRDKGN